MKLTCLVWVAEHVLTCPVQLLDGGDPDAEGYRTSQRVLHRRQNSQPIHPSAASTSFA
jgi:hypothetical protein